MWTATTSSCCSTTSRAATSGRNAPALAPPKRSPLLRNGILDDCVSYLDGAIFNIQEKVTNFDDTLALGSPLMDEEGLQKQLDQALQSSSKRVTR